MDTAQTEPLHRHLPWGVKILAAITILSGALHVLWGMLATGAGGVSWVAGLVTFTGDVRRWGGSTFGGGLLSLLVGIAQLIVGFALLRRSWWAWAAAALCALISLISPIVSLLHGELKAILGLIIPGLIFYYLLRRDVRDAFRGPART